MKKYKVGYTSGVYDMFHIGHLNILKRAKEQCEYLIVGVSTDELVQEYKHKAPIIQFEQRIEIVKAIRYVDEVIPQTSMDKIEVWKEYQFNAIFHGDEWKNSDLYKSYIEEFERVGVDMVFLPHTDGISSTIITERIRRYKDIVRESKNNKKQIYDAMMEKIHKCTQEILDAFVGICEENNLRYYLIAGTLLGAIRHKGPIPWDDDADVCMPREDFERFKQIMLAKPDGGGVYHIHCFENDPNYHRFFARLRKRGTIYANSEENARDTRFKDMWIDIFPLDCAPKPVHIGFCMKGYIIRAMKRIVANATLKITENARTRGKFLHFFLKRIPVSSLYRITEKLTKSTKKNSSTYYVSWGSHYSFRKQTMPKDWYEPAVKVLYSEKNYYAPGQWDKVLTQLYGDYMKLPPIEERVGHAPEIVLL